MNWEMLGMVLTAAISRLGVCILLFYFIFFVFARCIFCGWQTVFRVFCWVEGILAQPTNDLFNQQILMDRNWLCRNRKLSINRNSQLRSVCWMQKIINYASGFVRCAISIPWIFSEMLLVCVLLKLVGGYL